MKRILFCLLTVLGLTTAHGQRNVEEVDELKTKSGKTVRFHALMHASIRIEYDGREIEIDPVSKLRDRTVDYASMPKADYILITHEHSDHFDRSAISQLTADGTQLVTNKRCGEMLGYGSVMNNGDTLRISYDITLMTVPAYNTTETKKKIQTKRRDKR